MAVLRILQDFVATRANQGRCSFCGAVGKCMAALLDAVAEYITSHCLVGALGASVSASVIERLAELELRTSEIETRLGEIKQAIAAIDRTVIGSRRYGEGPRPVRSGVGCAGPTRAGQPAPAADRARGLRWPGQAVAITFRPTGIAWLAGEQRSAA